MSNPPEERFKTNLISLAEYIVDVNQDAINRGHKLMESSVLNLGVGILKVITGPSMVETFVRNSSPHWDKIRSRDQDYFNSKALDFFEGIPEGQIVAIRLLLTGKNDKGEFYVKDEVREMIWKYLESFVRISIRYLAPNGKGLLPESKFQLEVQNWNIKI
ncbi:hypothetical protein pv_466 [Pithovirus sibericum]|uniref:Uncharacterized protein n=1 Tax=Pithovirus sibericum TaxID=1450746 RepID=W5S6S4_9VIRU|nr:hypothetical protein pv_466 [Pithovirus sibericum]AHH02032.1 hypothetical protein pv_466 [Pithovirus sibericum]